jgi:DNA repair exonuclease SbcCD ATPase subunit
MIGFKAIMQDIKGKIDSLGNPIELEAELANTSTIVSNIDAERVNIISTLGSLRSKVNELVDILSSNNYDDIVRELEDVSNFVRSCQNSIKRKIQDYGISDVSKLSEFITSLDAKIVENEINKQNAIRDNQKLLSDREHEFSQLQEKQTKLQSLQSEYSYEDVLQEREKLIEVISKCEEVFNKMRLLNIEQITSSEFEYAMESLIELKNMAFNIVSECGIDILRRVVDGQESIYNIDDIRSQIINLEEEQHQLSSDISLYKTMRGSISDLDKRPKDCTISSCPFIESFLDIDIKYPKSVLDDMVEKSNTNSITLSSLRDILEDLEQYDIARRYLFNLSKELHSRMKFISKLPIRKDFESTFIDRLLNGDVFKDIDDMYSWVDQANLIEIYKKAKEQYIIYDSQYQVYKSKETIIESLIIDVKNLSDKLDKMDEELDANSNLIRILNTSLEDDRSMRQKASSLLADIEKDLNPSLEKMNQLQEKKNSFDSINIRLKQLNSDVAQNQSRLIILEEQFNKVSEKKESIRRAIALIKDYKNQLQLYKDNYGLLETIKYYSAPTTGISTVYIQIYMNNILNNANALLCTLFDGEFILQPFIIDENEFKIPCVGSGLPHDDVSSMSSAQRSMISTIIQASMLMASQSKYNILKLDEIDGALDSSNRSSFSNIIDRFMTMLNCEQIFIISHNSELDTSSMDIISLKGSDNMYGNVIWKY